MPWNERQDRPRDRDYRTRGTAPTNGSDEEFTRRLWEETDRSLRQSPERWVTASAGDLSFGTAGRAGEPKETGLRAYVSDADDLAAAQAERYRETARREHARREKERRATNLTASALKGWETRRANAAHAQAQAPGPAELP